MALKRSNGEVVTPFYFAYEDLREDWSKLVEQADAMDGVEEGVKGKMTKKLAAKPKVRRSFSSLSSYICFFHRVAKSSLSLILDICFLAFSLSQTLTTYTHSFIHTLTRLK